MAKVKCFRCSRTGVMFPDDYVEEWGRKYGIGLGPVPISEALTNTYHGEVAEAKDANKTMHPLGVCRAQVDLIEVEEEEFEANKAIIDLEDPDFNKRAAIMRDKQLQKSTKLAGMFPAEVSLAKTRIAERSKVKA